MNGWDGERDEDRERRGGGGKAIQRERERESISTLHFRHGISINHTQLCDYRELCA